MKNSWPTTVEELVDECERLKSRYDLYTLGEKGEPFHGESEPRVDGTRYLAGEYQYGVAMIPAQWVTHVLSAHTEPDAATVGKDIEHYDGSGRRATVAILQGGREPEEVLFVRDEGGVIHYLPEDATVGGRDTVELWPEWEQVLFANVSDEVAQDNLNECVHELLEKAATVGTGTCHMEVHDNLNESEGMGDVWLECD